MRYALLLLLLIPAWGHAEPTVPLESLLVDAPEWLRLFNGPVQYRWEFVGNSLSPHFEVTVSGDRIRIGEIELGQLNATVQIPLWRNQSDVEIRLTGALVRQITVKAVIPTSVSWAQRNVRWRSSEPHTGSVIFKRLDLKSLEPIWPFLSLAGIIDGELHLQGDLVRPEITGYINGRDIVWRGDSVGLIAAKLAFKDRQADITFRWGSIEDVIATVRGWIPLDVNIRRGDVTWLDMRAMKLAIKAHGITPKRLRPIWRAPAAADFSFDLDGSARGPLDAFEGQIKLSGTVRDRTRQLPMAGTVTVQSKLQTLDYSIGDDLFVLKMKSDADFVALRRTDATAGSTPISGRIETRIPLPTFGPYLPDNIHDPTGVLQGQIDITGSAGDPNFQGGLYVQDGAVTIMDITRRLEKLTLKTHLDNQKMTIEAISATSGPGAVVGTGNLILTIPEEGQERGIWTDWRLDGQLKLALTWFPFVHPFLPNGVLDSNIDMTLAMWPKNTELTVDVQRSKATLVSDRMDPAEAVGRNPRVQYVDWTGEVQLPRGANEDRVRVDINLADPILVEGKDATLKLIGRLIVERDRTVVSVDGGFDIIEGRVNMFDNDFEVRHGRLTIAAGDLSEYEEDVTLESEYAQLRDPNKPAEIRPLDPIIDFVSTGTVIDSDVLVRVIGSARQPQLELRSNPPLPEYQILTLLITWKADAVDGRGGDVRRRVSQLVSRFHNPSLSRQLYDRLGIDKLGLKFGSSVAQPILTVGKQLNRRLYIETVYHHNAPVDENEKEAHVEYDLNQRWTLDTTYGDAAQGSVGVWWGRRFGGPPVKRTQLYVPEGGEEKED